MKNMDSGVFYFEPAYTDAKMTNSLSHWNFTKREGEKRREKNILEVIKESKKYSMSKRRVKF